MSTDDRDDPSKRTFFGHPRGLSTLFFTEMWERFSFYGMKAMLFLFIIAGIHQGGLGIGEEVGGAIAGLYNSMVYLLALPGGWLADRLIGQRRAVLIGGIIIACGHYSMAVTGFFKVAPVALLEQQQLAPDPETQGAPGYWIDVPASERGAGFLLIEVHAEDGEGGARFHLEDSEGNLVVDRWEEVENEEGVLEQQPVNPREASADPGEEGWIEHQVDPGTRWRVVFDGPVEEEEMVANRGTIEARLQHRHLTSLVCFYLGLILIMIGTGLLKPNISTMVGELYAGQSGARRDAGFSIFYMGINLGAFLAPLLCGQVRQMWGWHYGFGLAGIGMTFGILWYVLDGRSLGTAGLEPKSDPSTRGRSRWTALTAGVGLVGLVAVFAVLHTASILTVTWTGVADTMGGVVLAIVGVFLAYVAFFTGLSWEGTKKVLVIAILFVFTALFWSGFEQASTSLNVFARDLTRRIMFGWEMPTEFLQAVNPLFIIALAPIFGAMWVRLAAKNINPSIPTKFALGLIQLSLGFAVIMFAAQLASGIDGAEADPAKGVMPYWLCMMYLLFTTGELCLSPIGLSAITKLSPPQFVSQMMGIWFIAAALGNLIAGRVGGMIEHLPHATIFRTVALIVGGAGLVLLFLSPPIRKRMMGGVE